MRNVLLCSFKENNKIVDVVFMGGFNFNSLGFMKENSCCVCLQKGFYQKSCLQFSENKNKTVVNVFKEVFKDNIFKDN